MFQNPILHALLMSLMAGDGLFPGFLNLFLSPSFPPWLLSSLYFCAVHLYSLSFPIRLKLFQVTAFIFGCKLSCTPMALKQNKEQQEFPSSLHSLSPVSFVCSISLSLFIPCISSLSPPLCFISLLQSLPSTSLFLHALHLFMPVQLLTDSTLSFLPLFFLPFISHSDSSLVSPCWFQGCCCLGFFGCGFCFLKIITSLFAV